MSGNDGGDLLVRNIEDGSIISKMEGHQTSCGITFLVKVKLKHYSKGVGEFMNIH